ncbi:hypothetical protein ACROYT_G011418 [Oculina patagonica]
MASGSDCAAKDLRHLSLEAVDEANTRKRKAKGFLFKRSRKQTNQSGFTREESPDVRASNLQCRGKH